MLVFVGGWNIYWLSIGGGGGIGATAVPGLLILIFCWTGVQGW